MAREIRISVRQTVNFETANAKFVRKGLHRVGSRQLPAVRARQPDGYDQGANLPLDSTMAGAAKSGKNSDAAIGGTTVFIAANMPVGQPEKNSANLQNTSRAEAAKLLNVSERSVNTAKKIERQGGDNCTGTRGVIISISDKRITNPNRTAKARCILSARLLLACHILGLESPLQPRSALFPTGRSQPRLAAFQTPSECTHGPADTF